MASPKQPVNPSTVDPRIAVLVDEYFDRQARGEALTPEQFAREHSQLADVLQPYLAGMALVGGLRSGGRQATRDEEAALPALPGYAFVSRIGAGGMGVVYEARQISTNRIVAIKLLPGGPFASDQIRRRFKREVELAARLQHPCIVRVLESGEVAGQPYFAMDHVTGTRLDEHLARSAGDSRAVLDLFTHICDAVAHAHSHGVVHRDLKPGNVLVDDAGMPHILDFGLAKATDAPEGGEALTAYTSMPGQVLGTLPYLTPEQAAGRGAEIDHRTDVYALGIMLYEALTGARPYDTTGPPQAVIRRILETPPAHPTTLHGGVPRELATIVLKALEKQPAQRYQSVTEMSDDLRRFREGEPILARPPSSLYVLGKMLRRNRTRIALAAGTLLVAVLSLAGGLWWSRQAQERQHDRGLSAARLRTLRAQLNLDHGEAQRALGTAQALAAQFPELPEAGLVLARAQFDAGMADVAIRRLEQQLQDRPQRWDLQVLLAEIYIATGAIERGAELLAAAEQAAPETIDTLYLRSFATLDLQPARRCLTEVLELDPDHDLARERLAHLCVLQDDLDEAYRIAGTLVEARRNPTSWMLFQAHVRVRQGLPREAIALYGEVIALRPENVSAYIYRAHAHRGVEDYARAVRDYGTALELQGEKTSSAWSFYHRATPLWILDHVDAAVSDCRQARERLGRPTYADARLFLMLRQQRRHDEAQAVLQAARSGVREPWLGKILSCLAAETTPNQLFAAADPADVEKRCEACYYAGEACLLEGRTARARQWFQRCVQTDARFDPDTFPPAPMSEYELARWRLKTLADNGS